MADQEHPIAAFNQADPYRSPRWRHDRAAMLARRRGKRATAVPNRDDEHVSRCLSFLRKWRRLTRSSPTATREARQMYLYPEYPDLFTAYWIFCREPADGTRIEIESRILSGESADVIASKSGVPEAAVTCYERTFFNVIDRLHIRGYIVRNVIAKPSGEGLEKMSPDVSAKYFAYFAGPDFLDFILDAWDPTQERWSPDVPVKEYCDRYWENNFRKRSVMAIDDFEINKFNIETVLQMHQQLLSDERKAKDESDNKTQFEEAVSAMLMAIPWSVGSDRAARLADSPLRDYVGHAAEPRAKDLLLIASGERPPRLDDIAERKLRDPETKEMVK